jgi:SAM-dependent methyltransferase
MPPLELRSRVTQMPEEERFAELGKAARQSVIESLPGGWTFDGKRVLDFGCGAGRVLRWFTAEAERCEFLACEIDAASVAWLENNLSPPFEVFRSEPEPPLPLESGSLDLIYATSVFTHLDSSWSRWLVELHRLLRPHGLLLATFLGDGIWPQGYAGRKGVPYDERVGMYVEAPWRGFVDAHGPAVWHSEWWLREHWGRLFEIDHLETKGFNPLPGGHGGQGYALMRPREVELAPEDLEHPADDPRELPAALQAAELLRQEFAEQMHHTLAERDRARGERDDAADTLRAVRSSRIMRMSEPARRGWYRLRGRR